MKIFVLLLVLFSSFSANSLTTYRDKEINFDILRKNKIIGSVETSFKKIDQKLFISTVLQIKVKILFIPAYKFYQEHEEVWDKNEFIKIEGYTDFEDEREYFIKGEDKENNFIASGMDGELILNKDILPLNYLNKEILNEKKLFDTQKGIVREKVVKRLKDEIINIKEIQILTEKFTLDASTNPKDKGPFPQYTLWYAKNGELVKFKFKNWKDNKDIITIRSDWDIN